MSHRHKGNFTLVELLVVIAVVAILAALLLPALNKAKETARGIVCLNNQKQVVFAMINYSEDNNGYLQTNSGNDAYWLKPLSNGQYLQENSPCLRCPSVPVLPSRWDYKYQIYGSRCDNNSYSPAYMTKSLDVDGNTVYYLVVKRLKDPSGYYQTGDTWRDATQTQWYYAFIIGSGSFYMAHNGAMNASFLDGHVGSIRGDDFYPVTRATFTSSVTMSYVNKNRITVNKWLP